MKKSLYIIAAALMLMCNGCKKEDTKSIVSGQWNITDIQLTTKSADTHIGDQKVDIYIDFKNDNSYEMYQMLGQGAYRHYRGTYKLAGNLLTGNYHETNKIRDWGNIYEIDVKGDVMTMTATLGSSDVYTYIRCTIPEEVRQNARR